MLVVFFCFLAISLSLSVPGHTFHSELLLAVFDIDQIDKSTWILGLVCSCHMRRGGGGVRGGSKLSVVSHEGGLDYCSH